MVESDFQALIPEQLKDLAFCHINDLIRPCLEYLTTFIDLYLTLVITYISKTKNCQGAYGEQSFFVTMACWSDLVNGAFHVSQMAIAGQICSKLTNTHGQHNHLILPPTLYSLFAKV